MSGFTKEHGTAKSKDIPGQHLLSGEQVPPKPEPEHKNPYQNCPKPKPKRRVFNLKPTVTGYVAYPDGEFVETDE